MPDTSVTKKGEANQLIVIISRGNEKGPAGAEPFREEEKKEDKL